MRANGWSRGRFAVGWRAGRPWPGIEIELDGRRRGPYAAMMRRDWRAAADEFGELGWSYDRR